MRKASPTSQIAFIAPEQKTVDLAMKISASIGIGIQCFVCSGNERISLVRSLEKRGVEVAVSRFGLSLDALRKQTSIPLVNVEYTGYDVLDALIRGSQYATDISIIHEQTVVDGAERIAPALGLHLATKHYVTSWNHDEVMRLLDKVRRQGIRVVLGGLDVSESAREFGLIGVRIEAGEDALRRGLVEAWRLIPVKQREAEKAQQMKTILDFISDGVIALDERGAITIFNKRAEQITGVRPDTAIGVNHRELERKGRLFQIGAGTEAETNAIKKVRDKNLIVNQIPIFVKNDLLGQVVTFNEVNVIRDMEIKARKNLSDRGLTAQYHFYSIVGESPEFCEVLSTARKYAKVELPVLITGETGTGKEMFAQSIHNEGKRSDGPFVAVNCGSLPENLLESELFGYVGGAFTGAAKEGKSGLIELAHNGTLFLDEIEAMSLDLQVRLLRVLEDKKIRRIGGDRYVPVDIRLISASNRGLEEMVQSGTFRADLFYRINVLRLRLPPLSARRTDILPLSRYFLSEIAPKYGVVLDEDVIDMVGHCLAEYNWPGNVRELKNTIEKVIVLYSFDSDRGKSRLRQILEKELSGRSRCVPVRQEAPLAAESNSLNLHDLAWESIGRALELCNGNRKQAAKLLGISTTTLWRRIAERQARAGHGRPL